MNGFTAPSSLLREVQDLDNLLLHLVTSTPPAAWHWPSLYMLYVDIDRMAWQIAALHRCFAQPLQEQERCTLADQVEGYNAQFAALDARARAIVHGLWHVSRSIDRTAGNEAALLRLKAHVHPKSAWYQALTSGGRGPGVSADGKVLERTVLLADPDTRVRIDDLEGRQLVQCQRFDLSSAAAMATLSAAVRDAETAHAQLNRALSSCFATHCTIADLLHPCSR